MEKSLFPETRQQRKQRSMLGSMVLLVLPMKFNGQFMPGSKCEDLNADYEKLVLTM